MTHYSRPLAASAAAIAVSAALSAAAVPALAKNTLRWASQGDALTYDPHSQNEGPTTTANIQVYEPLVYRNVALEKEPGLAVSWSNIEPTTWEFKLRQGVKFHDGADFDSEDVVFSFERAMSETSDYNEYLTAVESVKAIDSHTVHIITKGPVPIMADQLTSVMMMDKGWAEQNDVTAVQDYAGKEETYAARNANGTGPFKLTLREPDVRTITTRNANWWGLETSDHNIDEIIYTPISNAATRVAALLSGEVDFVLDPPLQDLARIKSTPGLKAEEINQIRTIFFGMDQGSAELRSSSVKGKNPFADVRVREAMNLAVDVEAIQKKVMRGLSFPAGIITSPGVYGYTKDLDARPEMDAAKAKALLTEAGYADGFDVKLDCPNNRYNNDEAICQAIVGMLGKVGIKVNLDAQPKSLHFPKIQNRTTDFYMLGWGVPTLDTHYVFSYLYQSEGSWNAAAYNNPKVDELTAQMEIEVDADKRAAMIQEAWELVKADAVYMPIHHQVIAWGMGDNLTLPIRPNDQPMFRFARME